MGRTWASGIPTAGRLSRYSGLLYGITVFRLSFPPESCTTTSSGSFCVAAMRIPPYALRRVMLGELILSRRHDQLQHLANTLVSGLGTHLTIPADLAPLFGLIDELPPRVGADFDGAQQIQTPIDQLLGAQGALGLQAVDDGADARQRRIADQLRDEVDTCHQGATVDPLLTRMPSFHARWIEQILTHVGGLHRQIAIAGSGHLVATHQTQTAHHHLSRGFHVLEAGVLEGARVEQHAEDGADVIVRFAERGRQGVERLRIARRLDRPGGHLGLVGDEEVVQMSAHEAGTGRLFHDDVDDVFAVETSAMAEKLFLAVIVILGAVLELPREPPIGQARDLGLEGPASEGA